MPLKKPVEVPKIPKARKKKVESVKSATPQKKKAVIEYKCKSYFRWDEAKRKQFCVLLLETVKEFSTFNYFITTTININKNNIDIVIAGLTSKQNYYTEVCPARSEILLENLFGNYTVNIIKQDGSINSAVYDFNLYMKKITLIEEFLPKKKNNRKFCEFSESNNLSTYSPEGFFNVS